MPLLTFADIENGRKAKLLSLATPPLTSPISLVHGLPAPSLCAISTPPPKKIFSILSWNIRDYKGTKIVAEKKGKEDNPFINQFVKVVAEALKIDLLMIIETDVDLTEAVSRIEDERDDLFGHLVTSPTAPLKGVDDPRDDESAVMDDQYWADVKKRVESLTGHDTKYLPIGSEMAFRKVNLPPSFTLADLQGDFHKQHPNGPSGEDGLEWWTYLKTVGCCYDLTFKSTSMSVEQLILSLPKMTAAELTADYAFQLKTGCGLCGGHGTLPLTENCSPCRGTGKPMDYFCPTCWGRGTSLGEVGCGACGGTKGQLVTCVTCAGTGKCGNCAGFGRLKCAICGGPQPIGCSPCSATGRLGFGPCPVCIGKGSGFMLPQCRICNSTGAMYCTACRGSGACPCGGKGTWWLACQRCGGLGKVLGTLPCADCRARGVRSKYLCQHCKGAGAGPCVGCLGSSCKNCGGAAKLPCVPCSGLGIDPGAECGSCLGTGTSSICQSCAGTGLYDPEAEDHVLHILRTLLSPKVFTNFDVETYTLLWRAPSRVLPVTVTGTYAQASGDKAVWIDPSNATLRSKDALGKELGYQDPKKLFNARMPYVIPLMMDLNGKKRQFVPIVLFHAVWGEVQGMKAAQKNPLVKQRGESIESLRLVGVPSPWHGNTIAVEDAPGSILVGDFNIDYNAGKTPRDKYASEVKQHSLQVFQNLNNKGYILPVGGTQTGLTTKKEGIARLQTPNGKDIHTYGYDNFLVKGADLQASIVHCGVFDVLKYIEDLLAGDPNLVKWIDNDYMSAPPPKPKAPKKTPGKNPPAPKPVKPKQPFADNRVRAFYLYYEYISDHLPIILDLVVDEVDAKHKTWLDEQAKFIAKPIDLPPPRYLGTWRELGPNPRSFMTPVPPLFAKIDDGDVTLVCFPDLVGVMCAGVFCFGRTTAPNVSGLLGVKVNGYFEVGEGAPPPEKPDLAGTWTAKVEKAAEKSWLVHPVAEKIVHVRGRVKWMRSNGVLAVATWGMKDAKKTRRVYEGPAKFEGLTVGDWVEGAFERK